MWRYLAGGVAALLMVAAGWMIFNGRASPDRARSTLPLMATAADAGSPQTDGLPPPLPVASERTREQKRFDRYDKDRDGKVTRDEYLVARKKAFAKLDTNGDGRLTFDEWSIKTTARFAAADIDRSGTMTPAEFATTAPKRAAHPKCACPQTASKDED